MLAEHLREWTRLLRGAVRRPPAHGKQSRRLVNRDGWDEYARGWERMRDRGEIPDLNPRHSDSIRFLGDEWSLMEESEFPYGIGVGSVEDLREYLRDRLLIPYLPAGQKLELLEIGPGGGRLTELLLPRCRRLYAVDVSATMLRHLQSRFPGESRIIPILTDGTTIPDIRAGTLDAFVSFDAFVHLDPWEIFRYLEAARGLLAPAGVGIVHFSDVESPIGFELFRSQVPTVLQSGVSCGVFSVMSKGIMERFLTELGFEVIAITNDIFPRDAVAVFRQGAN